MIKIKNLKKEYKLSENNIVQAVKDVSFELENSKIMALVGPSGSGKSTVLNILGGLDRDYEGYIEIDGKDLKKHNLNNYRRYVVQTVFQQFYLAPSLTVEENILLPLIFGNQIKGKKLKENLEYIVEKVGLKERLKHKPKELSGGQAQRVAIARALITGPKLLLADEPTGNLDSKTGKQIIELLHQINQEDKTSIVIITHDLNLITDVRNKVYLKDGFVDKIEE